MVTILEFFLRGIDEFGSGEPAGAESNSPGAEDIGVSSGE